LKTLRIVVGLLALAVAIVLGVRSCSAASAAIGGSIATSEGAAQFTAAMFLSAGFLLGGVVALLGRSRHGIAMGAAFFFLLANLYVGGGGSAAAGFTPWTWLSGAFAALLFGSGIYGLVRDRN
jgi:hypothetical protein